MSLALYRKYRSKSLDELIGQDHIVTVLKNAIANDRVAHAYLLTGPRGVGKTSVARILAHAINGIDYTDDSSDVDIIEIDAASNTSVDDVRILRDNAVLAPMHLKRKIYIIDEVHMLSKSAFNALLKILEEPPEHIVFILATTDIDKLPATVISRTQRFNFRAITPEAVMGQLRKIADSEKIKISDEALDLIARLGGGSFRDSISLLDQLSSLSDDITLELAESTLGLAPTDLITKLITATENGQTEEILRILDQARELGVGPNTLVEQLITTMKSSLVAKPELLKLIDRLLDVPKSPQPEFKLLSVLGTYSTKKANTTAPEMPLQATREPVGSVQKEVAKLLEFDWQKIIDSTRESHAPLYAILSKSDGEIAGDTLSVDTHNNFHKKKLDDPKYTAMLYGVLEELGITGLTVHTLSTPKLPKDSQAAKIVAMMGGEEVNLEG